MLQARYDWHPCTIRWKQCIVCSFLTYERREDIYIFNLKIKRFKPGLWTQDFFSKGSEFPFWWLIHSTIITIEWTLKLLTVDALSIDKPTTRGREERWQPIISPPKATQPQKLRLKYVFPLYSIPFPPLSLILLLYLLHFLSHTLPFSLFRSPSFPSYLKILPLFLIYYFLVYCPCTLLS